VGPLSHSELKNNFFLTIQKVISAAEKVVKAAGKGRSRK
jgi:hypothetical protein